MLAEDFVGTPHFKHAFQGRAKLVLGGGLGETEAEVRLVDKTNGGGSPIFFLFDIFSKSFVLVAVAEFHATFAGVWSIVEGCVCFGGREDRRSVNRTTRWAVVDKGTGYASHLIDAGRHEKIF